MLSWHLVKSTFVGVSPGSVLLFDVSGVHEWERVLFFLLGFNCLAQF